MAAKNVPLEKTVYDAVDIVGAISDPKERLVAASRLMHAVRAASEELRDMRHEDVVRLTDEVGMSYSEVGELIGTGKTRVQQIRQSLRPVRRPGIIEMETRLAAAQMSASGASDADLAAALVPQMRSYKGGDRLTIEQMATILGLDEATIAAHDLKKFKTA